MISLVFFFSNNVILCVQYVCISCRMIFVVFVEEENLAESGIRGKYSLSDLTATGDRIQGAAMDNRCFSN